MTISERPVDEHHPDIDEMLQERGLIDGDKVGEILTLRAARQGVYHLYTAKSVVKAVQNAKIYPQYSQIRVADVVGTKSYYTLDDAMNMEIRPRKARRSSTPEDLRKRLTEGSLGGWSKAQLKEFEKLLPLAEKAESIVKEYWRMQEQARREQAEKLASLTTPGDVRHEPRVANV